MTPYKKAFIAMFTTGVGFALFYSMNKLSSLFLNPPITASLFLSQTPNIIINGLILQQPSSTLLVMLLALITMNLGFQYLRKSSSHFYTWLGINFVLWGLGAFLAGLSYQAFGYQLKCVVYDVCLFTDVLELLYMSVTVLSINAFLMAYRELIHNEKWKKILQNYALISVVLYVFFQGFGMIYPFKFMVSYEGMLLFLSPNILIMMVISYRNRTTPIHQVLFKLWIFFLGVNIAYFVALFAGQGSYLLENYHLWFNENDTLHILLILWMVYFGLCIRVTPNKKL